MLSTIRGGGVPHVRPIAPVQIGRSVQNMHAQPRFQTAAHSKDRRHFPLFRNPQRSNILRGKCEANQAPALLCNRDTRSTSSLLVYCSSIDIFTACRLGCCVLIAPFRWGTCCSAFLQGTDSRVLQHQRHGAPEMLKRFDVASGRALHQAGVHMAFQELDRHLIHGGLDCR